MKSRSFFQSVKLFLFPIKENKIITLYFSFYFLLEGIFVVIFVFFVKHVTESLEGGNHILFQGLMVQYLIIFIITFIVLLISHKGWTYSYNRYRESIEERFFPLYVTFDSNIQEKIGTGKSIAIMSKGIKMWGSLLDNILIHTINLIVSLLLTGYLLFQVHSGLLFLLLFLLFLGQYIGIKLNKKVAGERMKRIELDNIWSKNVVKIIMAKMEILQTQKILSEVKKLHELHEGQIYYNKKMAFYLVPFYGLGYLIVGILLFVIFIYFGELYFSGQVSLGLIASLSGAILMMQKEFINMLDFLKNFGRDFAEVQNMWDFFDSTPQIVGYDTGKTFKHISGDIALKNISYGYDKNLKVFDGFSLDIPGNKIVALVGPSGGGKSTLVKLISGYIRQDSGDILVDSQNLKDVSLKSYYRDVGYLTQEPSVFDGTVIENLLYAVEKEPTKNHIEKIIQLAHCEFIYDLPDGLATEIGERGIKLSGGQKQRLAIAKIFLKDPKIIILDEPTSALDSLSEQKITEAMHNLFQGRTVLIIAHRLQTVKHADDIIVIEKGAVVERGTHSSLIRKNGYYKKMLDLQSGF